MKKTFNYFIILQCHSNYKGRINYSFFPAYHFQSHKVISCYLSEVTNKVAFCKFWEHRFKYIQYILNHYGCYSYWPSNCHICNSEIPETFITTSPSLWRPPWILVWQAISHSCFLFPSQAWNQPCLPGRLVSPSEKQYSETTILSRGIFITTMFIMIPRHCSGKANKA